MYFNIQVRCDYMLLILKQPPWMSSMYLGVISLGSKQIWLGHLIALLGCLFNHKLIKQKDISYNVTNLWDIIRNKIDWCLFSANVFDWFVRSLSASWMGKVCDFYNQVLSISKQGTIMPDKQISTIHHFKNMTAVYEIPLLSWSITV